MPTKALLMKPLLTLLLGATALFASAQEAPSIKFGKITPADLEKKVYALDSSASAVVLSDIGSTTIEGNSKGWFSLVYKQHKRIHILNKSGYDHADMEIPLYTDGNAEEDLQGLKAVTYNLENGKVVETRLEKENVFKEKKSKNLVLRKFTFPNVKEGSIIEFEYKMVSDFLFNLQPWYFQGAAPCLWSEYRVAIPQFLDYIFLAQGYHPFHLRDKKDRTTNFTIREDGGTGPSESFTFTAGITDYRWAMKDIPELKEEQFTSTLRNHIAKMEFQLSAYKPPLTYRNVMGSWPQLTKDLMESELFGKNLSGANGWLSDVVKPLVATAGSDAEKARNIFAWVRDNITCTDHSGIYAQQQLKNLVKTKNGNVSEVNLLLTAMLRHAGLDADPVILSTTEHGYSYALYPLVHKFNYVVAQVSVNERNILLDASHPRLGFGMLLPECYNGHARVVNPSATALELLSDSLREKKLTTVFITNGGGGKWIGGMKQQSGYYESCHIRDEVKEKGAEQFFKGVEKAFGMEVEIRQPVIDSLNRYEDPVAMRYDFTINTNNEDILYVNPMFGEGYKENPFKSAERVYPVEMPYTFDETYILNMQVPEGYVVDELPAQIAMKLNEEGDGYFEYRIQQSEGMVSLRSRLRLQRSNFAPEEYDFLREFFKMVVTKHGEQIVFKKKK